jgi:hypothetical protein
MHFVSVKIVIVPFETSPLLSLGGTSQAGSSKDQGQGGTRGK